MGTFTVSPFNWLEASYFYYRPDDLYWFCCDTLIGKGDYLDKGFNVKFSYTPKDKRIPKIAFGLDDFAGTGYFAREYFVATKNTDYFNISLGIGWGKFSHENKKYNPLAYFKESLEYRPALSENLELGGVPLYDTWFRGPIGYFGGIEFYIPKSRGLKVKIENDPFSYFDFSAGNRIDADPRLRGKESDINIGLSYPINDFTVIDLSFIKGNTINFSFTIGTSFNKKLKKNKKINPTITNNNYIDDKKGEFYRDLLNNLNNNSIFLQTANLEDKKLSIAVQSDEYRNHIAQSLTAADISNVIADFNKIDLNKIEVTNINVGIELNKITFRPEEVNKYKNGYPSELIRLNTTIKAGSKREYLNNEFKPKVDFPQVFTSYGPILVNHVGSPNQFYYGGIEFEHNSEIQFRRNLILNTKLNFNIVDNFDEKYYKPASYYLHHVRTDVLKYLQQGEQYISQMQLDYIFSPFKNFYAKTSLGILEKMYGGVGFEVLYKPFDNNFSIGADAYSVRQRSFDQRFDFMEYKTATGHLNLHYFHPKSGIHLKTSYGRYLAKDRGYTLDLSRETKSGFRAGFFFSRTNVSYEEFGEGSFDKGFYIQIPLDLFTTKGSSKFYNFKVKTLTRDGGAKLNINNDLFGLINNTSLSSIDNNWNWDGN